jgi:hypothetical protein
MRETRCLILSLALGAVLATPASGRAQNFLLDSAETINRGNFKLAGFATVLQNDGPGDDRWGATGRFGYGFTDRFDVEAKLSFFDGFSMYGADAELWLIRGPLDVSVSAGAHRTSLDQPAPDAFAIDAGLLVSGHVTRHVEMYGGFSMSRESVEDVDERFTRAYVVPGVEIALSDDLDLVAEYGIGLNDHSPDFLGFGLAFYLR